MAINLITQPAAGTPTQNTDYTQQNLLINGSITLPGANILTDWALTASAPDIATGSYIRHAGNLYQVQTSDYTPSGTPSAGLNYLKFSVSGTTLTAAWVTTFAGYAYNPAYNGWYSGTDQILFNGVYLDGVDYNRFSSVIGPYIGAYQFILASGIVKSIGGVDVTGNISATGNIDCQGNIFNSTGLDVEINDRLKVSGVIFANDSIINSATGAVEIADDLTVTGDTTVGGTISSSLFSVTIDDSLIIVGDTTSANGNFTSTNGDFKATNGNINAYNGSLGCDVISTSPTGGNDGDIVLYDSGAGVRRIYCKIGGTWRFVAVS